MPSLIFSTAPARHSQPAPLVQAHFEDAVKKLPENAADVLTSINATVAVRLFTLLLTRAVHHRLAPTSDTLAKGKDAYQAACDVQIDQKFDDMYVAYLATGLIAFLDLMAEDLDTAERAKIIAQITTCRDWLSEARHTRAFGRRETEGTYAWNHSVVAGAALALSTLWAGDPDAPLTAAQDHDIDFGLKRIEDFFIHGIRDGGVPYEGFFYCGVVMRVMGMFDILVARHADTHTRYQRIRARHDARLGQLLDWYGSSNASKQNLLISFNHSNYRPHPAVAGLLSFFRTSHPDKAGQIWCTLLQEPNKDAIRPGRDLPENTAYEALLFLSSDSIAAPAFPAQSLLSKDEGYALFVAEDGTSKLFVKSSKLLFGPHNQADAGHFTWIQDGRMMLIDAGPGAKVREPTRNWPEYSKGTYKTEGSTASSYGHNAILIDGKGQRPSGDGDGVEGHITYAREQNGFWCVGADAKPAYNQQDYNTVTCADRHIATGLKNASELVIIDHVEPRSGGPRTFERLLHFAGATELTAGTEVGHVQVTGGPKPVEVMTFATGDDLSVDAAHSPGQVPAVSRLVVTHQITENTLWMYTVVMTEDSNLMGAQPTLIPEEKSLSGDALRMRLRSGETLYFHVSHNNRLVCRRRPAQNT